MSELQHRRTSASPNHWRCRSAAERKRLDVGNGMRPSQVAEQQADVERMRALLALKTEQLQQLAVRAGMAGVLQAVPVEVAAR